jgi:hypothetical protein
VNVEEIITAIKTGGKLDSDPRLPAAFKSTFSQTTGGATTGLTFYDLEPGAKLLYPVLTPLRNIIPRVSGKGGIQANWKSVTGINTTNLDVGVSGGNRGAVMAVATQDNSAAYKGIGIEDNVDFEAQYAGQPFEDIRALAGLTGLQGLMLKEEPALLGACGTYQLGATNTPALAPSGAGGNLPAATYSVIAVALTLDGWINASVSAGIRQQVSRTNADGSTDLFGGGSAKKSTNATAAVPGSGNGSLVASVQTTAGALAYAWFWGAAGSEVLGAITTVPTVTITAAATGTQTAASVSGTTDYSNNALLFDGLLTQALRPGSGAYVHDLGGAGFTADNASGIVEIDAALKDRWDNYRLSPDAIWVSSQESLNVGKKILTSGTSGAVRFTVDMKNGAVGGGVMWTSYLNKFGLNGGPYAKGKEIPVQIHPNLPPGVMLMTTSALPYPLSNVGNVMQVRARQDYYQIEWPLRSRRWEYGVYADQVLQHYYPPSLVVITGIGNS